ncbi:ankyrin repeat-containing domain protein [Mycena rebaudengoi]|nr:ankyrin repeat-containing domain protein [Mycena rebaudengoi]
MPVSVLAALRAPKEFITRGASTTSKGPCGVVMHGCEGCLSRKPPPLLDQGPRRHYLVSRYLSDTAAVFRPMTSTASPGSLDENRIHVLFSKFPPYHAPSCFCYGDNPYSSRPGAFALDLMDPVTAVGLVASILQLVATAKSVIDLGRDACNVSKDQRDLFLEVQNLAPLLEDLKHRVQQPNNQSVNGLQKLEKPLGQLRETMEHINRKLGSANKVGSKALMWAVWSKKEVDADLAKIERFKAVLNAWLLLDNWDVGQQQEKNYNLTLELEIRTELGNISQNQREYQDEISKTLSSNSNMQRQDNYRILTEVRNVAQDQHNFLDSAERDKIIEWLSPLNFFARHDDIFRTRQEGTGRWFLEDSRFRNWLSSTEESIWCSGIPGAGKTVLASIVVDYLRSHLQSNHVGVAVAYLNHKESEAQSPPNILAGLWWQLASERLISPLVQQLYQKHQSRRTSPSLDEVREIFHSTVAEYSKVFVVVDALDEYPEAHRHILLNALAAIGGSVCLMLTSRPNISPKSFFPTAPVVEIRAQEEDICRYIGAQIQNSFRLSKHVKARPELSEEIEIKIAKNTDGMFLIAKLHIDSLATKSTVKAVRDALQNLPEDLEHTYDEAMDRIKAQNKEDREIARRTLIWVANTKRPLTVFELQEALAVDPNSKMLDADGLLDIEIILSVCVGLVIIDASQSRWLFPDQSPGNRIVRLVHLTIQDYLDRVRPIRFPEAQTEIIRNCLTYISYYSHDNVPKSRSQEPGLLSYASSYCLLHAAGEPELVLQDSIIQFLGDAHRYRVRQKLFGYAKVPLQWYHPTWPLAPSKLWVAALFGLQHIAKLLLESDKSISEEDKEGSLEVASQWNCSEIVRLLIKHGTNGDAQLPFIGKVLRAVSGARHTKTVQLLLENGADVNAQGGEYGTALHAASAKGCLELVQLLLEHGANPNLQRGEYGSALQEALVEAHEGVVQLLLEHGANVNAQGGYYGTALQAVSAEGEEEVVQLLLENGADVNLQGGTYGTALQAASWRGNMELVQMLLEHDADVNLQGGKYGTALQAASWRGNMKLVQMLLEHDADVGNMELVQMLLEHDTDVNVQGGTYGTALQAASWWGSIDTIQLLLEHGANINLQGGYYGTVLQAVSWLGSIDTIQLLLEHGADVNLQGGYYGTALQAVSWQGSIDTIHLLLEHGADVNLQGGYYGTTLQAASWRGSIDTIQLLLEHGADVNLQGGYYGTALQAASAKGSMEVVQFLLKHGANVNARGGKYGTAYRAAKSMGRTKVAEFLVAHGADTIWAWNRRPSLNYHPTTVREDKERTRRTDVHGEYCVSESRRGQGQNSLFMW